jgi:hypothetical protein
MPQGTANLVTSTATTAPLSYNIAPCNVYLNRVAGEGVYTLSLVGTTVANTIAAPASNSRWDLIYVMQNDLEKGDPDNGPVVGVVNGAAAAAPTKPYSSVPAGALVLAEAQIFSGTTATNGGTNTLAQVWQYTAARGDRILCRTKAERDTITAPFIGLKVVRLDRNNHEQTWNGTAWKWTSTPERYWADPTTFVQTAAAGAQLVGSIPNTVIPTRSYAQQARVVGQLTMYTTGLAAGAVKGMRVAVSAQQSSVGNAQGKALMIFSNPGSYYLSQRAETPGWIAITANNDPLVRIWMDVTTGTANTNVTNSAVENWLYCDILPADD